MQCVYIEVRQQEVASKQCAPACKISDLKVVNGKAMRNVMPE